MLHFHRQNYLYIAKNLIELIETTNCEQLEEIIQFFRTVLKTKTN